jgi:transposase
VDLTDEQWDVLDPLVPTPRRRPDGRGRPWRDPRDVLNGILWILKTGAPWQDLPRRYPPYQTCHRRYQAWVRAGVLDRVLYALAEDCRERGHLDLTECFVDGTFLSSQKRGPWGGTHQAGQRYEDHGSGRWHWPSSRRPRGQCFAS